MMLTLKVKLDPTEDQFNALKDTMKVFNRACGDIAQRAFETQSTQRVRLHHEMYYTIRKKYGLSAQLTVRAIAKAATACNLKSGIIPQFKPYGAIVYDNRIMGWKGLDRVSILTLEGRKIVPVIMSGYHKAKLNGIRGEADLILQKGVFYLCVTVDAPEPDKIETNSTLGIDMGIVNIAADSDGNIYSGEKTKVVRTRYQKFRGDLQSAGTKSAKRHLKLLSGKESRFQKNVNHCIAKELVAKAKDTKRMLALENLTGIRKKVTVRKAQRYYLHSWAFYQLKTFIKYKAALAGIPVVFVNPRGTSHTCPKCGCNEKRNRPDRDTFRCSRCGFAGHADHVAAINIAARAAVNRPIVACHEVEAVHGIETKHSYKPSVLAGGSITPPASAGGN